MGTEDNSGNGPTNRAVAALDGEGKIALRRNSRISGRVTTARATARRSWRPSTCRGSENRQGRIGSYLVALGDPPGGTPNGAAGQSFPGTPGIAGPAGVGSGAGLNLATGSITVIDNTSATGNHASTQDNDVAGTICM
jgi:hypothetical protein